MISMPENKQMVFNVAVVALLVLGVAFALVAVYGTHRWEAGTRELRLRLEAARVPTDPTVVDMEEFDDLPSPVQRYFRAALKDGQLYVVAATIEHSGEFNMGETGEQWKSFASTQRVIAQRPGFDWDARIAMMPGLRVHVHDAYVAGEGLLHAALFGLVPLANMRGGGELARGELMRFLAEATWYPTSLLPSQGVRWEVADDHSAHATLNDGKISLRLLFSFKSDGLINTVRAEERGRKVGEQVIPTPWQGRFWNYTMRGGMRIPLEGEVAWLLPEGPKPYWRGRITRIDYEFAR
jgi:hypothetical protein